MVLLYYFFYYLPSQKKNLRPNPLFQHQGTQTPAIRLYDDPQIKNLTDRYHLILREKLEVLKQSDELKKKFLKRIAKLKKLLESLEKIQTEAEEVHASFRQEDKFYYPERFQEFWRQSFFIVREVE
ncbi:hypothetical protein C1645_744398 [Glomus cerebriforme]|uniref:Uncharacterized protein n=1 Tax=Glomus cerebriforme TaxID=658196 RepID=A0A397SFS4_9GLOM|nr:hypothetical protein C1645_744385 [Glomus cerebriforme]RIA81622.1 hypothetical protein C1645_744398 [Glomus cerebriforme]